MTELKAVPAPMPATESPAVAVPAPMPVTESAAVALPAGMVSVTFSENWALYSAGETTAFPASQAEYLVARKIAVKAA